MRWTYLLASAIWMVEAGTSSSLQQRTLWLKSMMLKWSSMVRSSRMAVMASTVCGWGNCGVDGGQQKKNQNHPEGGATGCRPATLVLNAHVNVIKLLTCPPRGDAGVVTVKRHPAGGSIAKKKNRTPTFISIIFQILVDRCQKLACVLKYKS